MKKFDKRVNTETTSVKLYGQVGWWKVRKINDTRINIQVRGLGGSFQRGHVEKFTNEDCMEGRIPYKVRLY